jgi:DNA-binding transcriptional LysR family regulator
VAFFMAEPSEYVQLHPIFGRSLQLVPVPVEPDGSARTPLHEHWQRDGDWWSPWRRRRRPQDPEALRRNLARSGVDYALVSRWSLGEWPPQREALARALPGPPLYDDGYSVLWRITP